MKRVSIHEPRLSAAIWKKRIRGGRGEAARGRMNLSTDGDGVLLDVKVVPGSSGTRYLGPWGRCARFAVAAAPEKGRANEALCRFIAETLGVRRQAVSVVAGPSRAVKTVRITGVTPETVRAALDAGRG